MRAGSFADHRAGGVSVVAGAVMNERTALSRRQRLKRVAEKGGIDSIAPLWKPVAVRAYRQKFAREAAYRKWCETVGWQAVTKHWGSHDLLEGEFERLHVASQLYEITETLRRRIGDLGDRRVLDAGASDGLFLRRIGARNGVGLNFLEECVGQIEADGYEARLGDIEQTPFDDNEFPIVICCETLEHVPNPIAALNELGRICGGRIYLTIPWLPRTRITARSEGWPLVEGHIFEFSSTDFVRIMTHSNLRIVHRQLVQVFPEPKNPLWQVWLRLLMYPNFFPKLQYYELEPIS